MTLNPDIRDQAYQFFIQEAPELLQTLEAGLLTLSQERSPQTIHQLMRAAHSLKGGASSVGLEAIATIAHRLEHILKALYSDSLTIDPDLEDQLLQAYDCLRIPLVEQISYGQFQPEQALATADPIFTQIEERLGDALTQTEYYIPSSQDLGVNMVTSIMEVDVAQGLTRLSDVLTNPQNYEVGGELRAQAEVFSGFAELLNIPELAQIAAAVQQALTTCPDRALDITRLALDDFEQCRQAVLQGDGSRLATLPSGELMMIANAATLSQRMNETAVNVSAELPSENPPDPPAALPSLEDIFGGGQFLSFDADELIAATAASGGHEAMPLDEQPVNVTPDPEPDVSDGMPIGNQLVTDFSSDLHTSDAEDLHDAEFDGASSPVEAVFNATSNAAIDRPFDSGVNVDPAALEAEPEPEPDANLDRDPATWNAADSFNPPSSLIRSPVYPVPFTPLDSVAATPLNPVVRPPVAETVRLRQPESPIASHLTVRVDSERLEQMNNLVGELSINRDGLSLQNDQLQGALRTLLNRFSRFQTAIDRLRTVSDQMLTHSERQPREGQAWADGSDFMSSSGYASLEVATSNLTLASARLMATRFDSLEMDNYGALHSELQEIMEEMVQLEETVDDITLFAKQSDEKLTQQQSMLTELRDELIWVRMLPLGEILQRFPRILRDLSMTYHKPVNLTLIGTDVLVDKAVLERLYDPLLHLLRNAFDHGIEPPGIRQQYGKPEQGEIEIRAYRRANQTIIEVKDDGQGIDFDRIRCRVLELGWMSPEQVALTPPKQLLELMFEPGFSTARQVNELSGRGVGLDVVRSQLQSVKGVVTVTSTPGRGTVFTLALPLTLTISKLVIILAGSHAFAISADTIEEMLTPQANQIRQSGGQRFLYWQEQIIPVYRLAQVLDYACPTLPTASKTLASVPTPANWASPMLIIRAGQQVFALEVDQLVTEQELVIKPLGGAISPPSYIFGCTILGDGSLIPVIDGIALIELALRQGETAGSSSSVSGQYLSFSSPYGTRTTQVKTVLVVDDAVTLRRTLALSLERAGFRVLQARDGQEAIEQLQESVQIIICDIEMPNMNGFEFLNYRRQHPQIAAIPVIMLTSRSNDKHRWLAMQLGATTYLTKPYLEQELLATIAKL